MRASRNPLCSLAQLGLSCVLALGCDAGQVDRPDLAGEADAGPGSAQPEAGGPADGGGGDAAPAAPEELERPGEALLPARIRRLSNAEYGASAQALLGELAQGAAAGFAPDARQDGFTVNEDQRVDPVLAKQLFATAERLAAEAGKQIARLAPCSDASVASGSARFDLSAAEACAKTFIASFGARAYRRPLRDEETSGLLALFRAGAEGSSYADGIELVVQAVLQSAGFLYLTELGDGRSAADGKVRLTADELASSLSYLLTAAPPDAQLLAAAHAGRLETAAGRGAEARRLREQGPSSEQRLTRALHEWLELDRLESTTKDSKVYPAFDGLKPEMLEESRAFVRAVLADRGAPSDLETLLGADWTLAGPGLAELYGGRPRGDGRLSLPTRRGVLNQAGFLSVQAHAHESTPVLRGARVAKRVACQPIPSPSDVKIEVIPPVPDPTLTTRERFAAHSKDLICAACHLTIDSLGNAFELFDGMGRQRSTENGRPVDSSTVVHIDPELNGPYADSNGLSLALARSALVSECFARHLFRSSVGRSGEQAQAAEDAFIARWQALPEGARGNVMDTLLTFIESPLFARRGAP